MLVLFGADFTDYVGEAAQKQTHFLRKKHVLSPCLGTSPWVGRFCSKVHTKHNGSKSCIFATLVGKGLIRTLYRVPINENIIVQNYTSFIRTL